MQALDRLIAQQLQSGVVLVAQVAQYIVASGGKRVRPVLLMLVSRALGVTDARIETQQPQGLRVRLMLPVGPAG